MIPGFEEYTENVNDSDIDIINLIAKGLNLRIGIHEAITSSKAIAGLYINKAVTINGAKFRRYIQYIRAYNLCPMLCASKKGYWIAATKEEYIKYRNAYASRISSMEFTKACLFHYDIENNVIN